MIGSNDKRKIAVFANDAGGANLILFFIKRKKIKNPSFFLKGPALKIFKKNIKKFQNKNISNFNKSYDLILTGTSWSSDFEKKALIKAKKLKINSITMLDHYINYRKRFTINKKLILPDQILVNDIFGKKILQKTFKNYEGIKIIKNFYFLEIIKKFKSKKIKKSNKRKILYLTEPISKMASRLYNKKNFFGFNEVSAFKNFLERMNRFTNISINVKIHPSENQKKYKIYQKISKNKVKFLKEGSVEKFIFKNDVVISCGSYALLIAKILKKKIICSSPKNSKYFQLPLNKISYLENIKKL